MRSVPSVSLVEGFSSKQICILFHPFFLLKPPWGLFNFMLIFLYILMSSTYLFCVEKRQIIVISSHWQLDYFRMVLTECLISQPVYASYTKA